MDGRSISTEEKFQPIDNFDAVFDKTLKPLKNVTIKTPIINAEGIITGSQEYQLDASSLLGRSNLSRVHSAERLSDDTQGNASTKKKFAVKILKHPSAYPKNAMKLEDKKTDAENKKIATQNQKNRDIIQRRIVEINKEVQYLSRHYLTEKPLFIDDKAIIIISESLPGQELCTDRGIIHPDLKKLKFIHRTKVAAQLVSQVNELHHNKPTTGNAIIHGDLKGSNVKLFIDPETLESEVYIIDYGLSLDAPETEDMLTPHPNRIVGSHVYFPVETEQSQFGIKTDLYMQVALLTIIFGETDPYRIKMEYENNSDDDSDDEAPNKEQQMASFQKPHPLDKVMPAPRMYLDLNVRDLILRMLNRMQSNTYLDRPDSDDVTLFFVLLNKLACVHEKTPNDTLLKAGIIAKMWLTTTKEWHGPINRQSLSSSDAAPYAGKKFSEFDFGKDMLATQTIASLCNCDLKRNPVESASASDSPSIAKRARAIAILSETLLLDDDIAVTIYNDTPLSALIVATTLGERPSLTAENKALCSDIKATGATRQLVQLAAHHGDWETVVHLLFLMPKTTLNANLTYFLNQNTETLITIANRVFKRMSEQDQLTHVNNTIQKQNALGMILNTPKSVIGFMFKSRKFSDIAITERVERLISDLACYETMLQNKNKQTSSARLN